MTRKFEKDKSATQNKAKMKDYNEVRAQILENNPELKNLCDERIAQERIKTNLEPK